MLRIQGSCPSWKGSGFGTDRASGSRLLPKLEGFRVWDARCCGFKVLAQVGRVQGLGQIVLPGPGYYQSWKGLGFGVERASSCTSGKRNKTPGVFGLRFLTPVGTV